MQHSTEARRAFTNGDQAEHRTHDAPDIELLDLQACRGIVGGTKPIHAATIYRLIQAGKLPRPIKIGGSARWLKGPFMAALQALIEEPA